MTETGCTCVSPGFCSRHKVNKNPHFFNLCQNHHGYFKMWSECRGPGQSFIDCTGNSETREPVKLPEKKSCAACANQAKIQEQTQQELKENLPSLWEQAKSLTTSVVTHVATGMKKTTEELQNERLAICEQCPLLIRDSMRCGACGCYVKAKTKMESAKCPKGHW